MLGATREIVEKRGLAELSAREIARGIGYSAGTIYNVFENLDDLLLTIQIELLDDAVLRLQSVTNNGDARHYVDQLSAAYIDFALENRRVWNLLFQHHLPSDTAVPAPFHDNINRMIEIVTIALAPLMAGAKPEAIDRTARVMWAGVHGISAIAVTDKAPTMTSQTAQEFVKSFTATYLAGLK